MTKEQFSVWLVGYLHINVLSRPTATIEVLKMGDEVLAAAWSVPINDPPFAVKASPITEPPKDVTPEARALRKPQPGDLDYDGPTPTSNSKQGD